MQKGKREIGKGHFSEVEQEIDIQTRKGNRMAKGSREIDHPIRRKHNVNGTHIPEIKIGNREIGKEKVLGKLKVEIREKH